MPKELAVRRVLADVDAMSRAGLDSATFLEESMASIARAVGYVAGCVATVDPSTLLITDTLKYGDLRGNDAHDHEWGLIEYGTAEPTSFSELAHRASPAVATRAHDPTSPRLNDYLRRTFGYDDELRVVLRDRGQVWGGIALFRGDGDQYFDAAETDLLAQLSVSLCIGLRAGILNRLADPTARQAHGPAVLIVDGDDVIQQYSAGAEIWLDEFLTSDTGTLPTGVFAGLIGAARRFAAGHATRPPRCRVRARSGQWVVLHASPMSTRGDGGGRGDVVVTIDEARPPEIVPLIVAAFDLTPRERDVTQLVLQGLDTKDIASSMHLSRYTVQDHLKSVFEKADVRSRRELIARIYFDQYVPRMGSDLAPVGWLDVSR